MEAPPRHIIMHHAAPGLRERPSKDGGARRCGRWVQAAAGRQCGLPHAPMRHPGESTLVAGARRGAGTRGMRQGGRGHAAAQQRMGRFRRRARPRRGWGYAHALAPRLVLGSCEGGLASVRRRCRRRADPAGAMRGLWHDNKAVRTLYSSISACRTQPAFTWRCRRGGSEVRAAWLEVREGAADGACAYVRTL